MNERTNEHTHRVTKSIKYDLITSDLFSLSMRIDHKKAEKIRNENQMKGKRKTKACANNL